jgi:hypothetical protein
VEQSQTQRTDDFGSETLSKVLTLLNNHVKAIIDPSTPEALRTESK